MVINPIRAVLFDIGGTLGDLYYSGAVRRGGAWGLREFLRGLEFDPGLSLLDLQATVFSGLEAYQSWREQSEGGLPDVVIHDLRQIIDLVTPHTGTAHGH